MWLTTMIKLISRKGSTITQYNKGINKTCRFCDWDNHLEEDYYHKKKSTLQVSKRKELNMKMMKNSKLHRLSMKLTLPLMMMMGTLN